ncbi:hypothetical protein C8J57DRAFT_1480397 [Mycena rebaudengoi]|nr:hypothetical protein C8J57DRAFT_1480397 [Mycena rebaudengoi]
MYVVPGPLSSAPMLRRVSHNPDPLMHVFGSNACHGMERIAGGRRRRPVGRNAHKPGPPCPSVRLWAGFVFHGSEEWVATLDVRDMWVLVVLCSGGGIKRSGTHRGGEQQFTRFARGEGAFGSFGFARAEKGLSDSAGGHLLLLPLGHGGIGVFVRAPVDVVLSSGRVDIVLSMRVHVEWAQLEDVRREADEEVHAADALREADGIGRRQVRGGFIALCAEGIGRRRERARTDRRGALYDTEREALFAAMNEGTVFVLVFAAGSGFGELNPRRSPFEDIEL